MPSDVPGMEHCFLAGLRRLVRRNRAVESATERLRLDGARVAAKCPPLWSLDAEFGSMSLSNTNRYQALRNDLVAHPRVWLVTGVAGFIGSSMLETLLGLGQTVVGLDDFSTGYQANIDDVLQRGVPGERRVFE